MATKLNDTVEQDVLALPEFQQNYLDNLLATMPINPDTGVPDVAYVDLPEFQLIVGTAGDDDIFLDDGVLAHITAGAGDDSIVTGIAAGLTIINGGTGNDSLFAYGEAKISGGAGDDTIATDVGNDQVSGGDGNDDIATWDGNDIIYGGNGDDTIDAGDGDDIIIAGAGNDIIYGGDGRDTFVFGTNDGVDTVYDFQVGDQIEAGASATFTNNGNDDWTMTYGQTTVDVQVLGVTSIVFDNGVWVGQ